MKHVSPTDTPISCTAANEVAWNGREGGDNTVGTYIVRELATRQAIDHGICWVKSRSSHI